MKTVLLGDFNLNWDIYNNKIIKGLRTGKKYHIFDFLANHSFEDIHPSFTHQGTTYKFHTFSSPTAKSRIDYIWTQAEIANTSIHSTIIEEETNRISDHRMLAAFFPSNIFLGNAPINRMKQRNALRRVPDYDKMTESKWKTFGDKTDQKLNEILSHHPLDSNRALNFQTALNKKWMVLKQAIKASSRKFIKQKTIGLNTRKDIRSQLLTDLYGESRYVVRILRRVNNVRFHPSTIDPQEWIAIRNKIINIANNRNFPLSPIITPSFTLNRSNNARFRSKIIKLKGHLDKLCEAQEEVHTKQQVKYYTEQRCTNYTKNQAAFIASALERRKRTIILDRIAVQRGSHTVLLTEEEDVKKETNRHFQTAARIPSTLPPQIPERWISTYQPLQHINDNIYNTLLEPPTDEE